VRRRIVAGPGGTSARLGASPDLVAAAEFLPNP
jgi:hypothetical protein